MWCWCFCCVVVWDWTSHADVLFCSFSTTTSTTCCQWQTYGRNDAHQLHSTSTISLTPVSAFIHHSFSNLFIYSAVASRDENGQVVCGVKLKDRLPSKVLRERLGIDDIALVLQQIRLRWYGRVLWKEDDDYLLVYLFIYLLMTSATWKKRCPPTMLNLSHLSDSSQLTFTLRLRFNH